MTGVFLSCLLLFIVLKVKFLKALQLQFALMNKSGTSLGNGLMIFCGTRFCVLWLADGQGGGPCLEDRKLSSIKAVADGSV